MNRDIRDDDEEGRAGAAEFARMLDEFESSREAETPAIGSRVRGRIVMIGEATSFVDFGGRSEGAVESVHLRKPDGSLAVEVGDTLDLFVIENRDQVILAPTAKIDPADALAQIHPTLNPGTTILEKVPSRMVSSMRSFLIGGRSSPSNRISPYGSSSTMGSP